MAQSPKDPSTSSSSVSNSSSAPQATDALSIAQSAAKEASSAQDEIRSLAKEVAELKKTLEKAQAQATAKDSCASTPSAHGTDNASCPRTIEEALKDIIVKKNFWTVPETDTTVCALTLKSGCVVLGRTLGTTGTTKGEEEIAYNNALANLMTASNDIAQLYAMNHQNGAGAQTLFGALGTGANASGASTSSEQQRYAALLSALSGRGGNETCQTTGGLNLTGGLGGLGAGLGSGLGGGLGGGLGNLSTLTLLKALSGGF